MTSYSQLKSELISDVVSTIEQVSDISLLTASGNSVGDQRVVGNTLYIWNGTGWYRIALINETPTWDSGGQPSSTYILDADSPQDATIITLAATDPDGLPINYSYVTGGSMDSIATVLQDSSVFTITPKTAAQAPDGGTGTITFRASDGVNILPQVSSFTLNFISTITNSKYTTLLATADGTLDNNNIADASTNNHSITVNNDAHAGTFSPYRHGGYSLKFNGTANNYIRVPWWPRSNLGTNDFTVECFVYPTNNFSVICDLLPGSAGLFRLATWTGGNLALDINKQGVGAYDIRTTGGNINYNAWNHVAVCRSGTSLKLYANGSLIHTESGGDWDYGTGDAYSNIGRWNTTGDVLNGYISNFRVKNSALYTGSTYTVPTEGFTSDAGTTLLVGAGAVIDNVTPYGVETYGTVTSEPFSPYDYLEYSATDHGGSIYFDTSDDYLTVPNGSWKTYGSSNFTIECWFYADRDGMLWGDSSISGLGDNCTVIADLKDFNGANAWVQVEFRVGSTKYGINPAQGTFKRNAWNHIAFVRNGNTFTVYSNGKDVGNTSQSGSMNTSPNNWAIASAMPNATGTQFNGYISDFRVSKSARYTAEFTPPTAPLSSSGAELHIKGTDASIIDKSQGTNLKLYGTTTGSTTQVKFADTKSMYFDGNSDYLTFPHREELNFASNDWTIECWIYPKTNVGDCGIWHQSASGTDWNSIYLDGSFNPKFVFYHSSNNVEWAGTAASNTAPQNTWTHLALVRKFGTGVYLFAGGTLVASDTNDASVAMLDKTYDHVIGYERFVGSGTYFDGYIQDFRITNGLARYINALNPTTNFTPPAAPLEG